MTIKLNDTQLIMMSAAAQREDCCLKAPETLKGAAVGKVAAKLVKLGLAREVKAKPDMPIWRRNEGGQAFALKLTAAGLKAIAVEEEEPQSESGRLSPISKAMTSKGCGGGGSFAPRPGSETAG